MFNFLISNIVSNYPYYKRFIKWIVLTILLILTHSFSYFYGKWNTEDYYENKYNQELISKLKEQELKNIEQLNKIKDNINTEEKIRVIYKDRIKTVKEIIKADNFKCEMTDEQIKNLNSFKKPS